MMCEKQWFLRTRIAWIHESIRIFGFINREHIMKKFGIAQAQASHDLKLAMKWHPNLMQYDASRKCYVEQQPRDAGRGSDMAAQDKEICPNCRNQKGSIVHLFDCDNAASARTAAHDILMREIPVKEKRFEV